MKRYFFGLLLIVSCASSFYGQCPFVGSRFDIRTQQEIDSFPIVYRDCDLSSNQIVIRGSSITSIDPLTGFDFNSIIIDSTSLIDLSGLSSVKRLRFLSVKDNSGLQSLSGFDSLRLVEGAFGVSNNPRLTRLGDFPVLDTIGNMNISDNDSLLNFKGMEHLSMIYALTFLDEHMTLEGLDNLRQLNVWHLSQLGKINSIRQIIEQTSLEEGFLGEIWIASFDTFDLSGIGQMNRVWNLKITNTFNIDLSYLQEVTSPIGLYLTDTTLSDLQVLAGVPLDYFSLGGAKVVNLEGPDFTQLRGLGLGGCPNLHDISAAAVSDSLRFEFIFRDYVEANTLNRFPLTIRGCPMLSDCAIEPICQRQKAGLLTRFEVGDNGIGCSTPEEIEEACMRVSTIEFVDTKGIVYPNPTSDLLHLMVDDLVSWMVINMTGQVCMRGSTNPLDVSALPVGVYVLRYQVAKNAPFSTIRFLRK